MNEEQRKFFEGLYQRLVDIDEYIVNDNSISEDDKCFKFACDVCQNLNEVMYWIDGYLHGQILG